MGEPAGIGGEIALKAWLAGGTLPPFFMLDDPGRLTSLARRLGWPVPVIEIAAPEETQAAFARGLPVLPELLPVEVVAGQPDRANAPAVLSAIRRAVALAHEGKIAGIVTNPINKGALYAAGFEHPGHTEYLAELAGGNLTPVMMLVGGGLRVVPVTIHLSLREALAVLDRDTIVGKARIAAAALRTDFGIARPRLAIAALNPHAGEGGALGRDEIEIIEPAVERLRQDGIDVAGPLPADTLFHAGARSRYDATICMYHDQALIPLKTLDFERGVNVTLGLPFVRTSPDHGTAFGIAGTGAASEASLTAALVLAGTLATQRARLLERARA
jgi:4-hydroxythreonine-4-phosphate dehydrogenase